MRRPTKAKKPKADPLYPARPRNYGIGNAVQVSHRVPSRLCWRRVAAAALLARPVAGVPIVWRSAVHVRACRVLAVAAVV